MTVGMTLWMRHRRHSWAMCAEMAAAMLVPAVIAIALFWVGVLATGRSIGAVEMVVMVPAMIAVMLLRRKRVLRTRPQAGAGDREPKHLKPRGAGDNRCDGGSGRVPGPASSGSSR